MADYYSSNRATTANSKDFILTDEAEQHFPSEGLYIGSLSGNNVCLPALVDLTEVKGLCFLYNNEELRSQVNRCIERLIWRVAAVAPSQLCDLILYNGGNPGDAFNTHVRINKYLFDGRDDKVFYDRNLEQFNQLLDNVYGSILDRMSTIRCNGKKNLTEYNETLGNEARLKYQFIFLTDFPRHLTTLTAQKLEQIITSGSKAGIHVIMSWDMNADFEDANNASQTFDPHKMLADMQLLFPQGNTYQFRNSGHDDVLNRFSYTLDDRDMTNEEISALIPFIDLQVEIAKKKMKPSILKQDFDAVEGKPYQPVMSEISVTVGLDVRDKRPVTIKFNSRDYIHAFILGQSGSGKSVLLNNIITTAALKYSPQDLMFYLMDFKGVEFNKYRGLKHTKAVLVDNSDPQMTLEVLRELREENKLRVKLWQKENVANIDGYNTKYPNNRMPQILFVADECQVMFKERTQGTERIIQQEISEILNTIATQGRSQGIHMLLATQQLDETDISGQILKNLTECFLMMSAPSDSNRLVPDSSDLTSKQMTGLACYYHKQELQSQVQTFFAPDEKLEAAISAAQNKARDIPGNGEHYFCGSSLFYLAEDKEQIPNNNYDCPVALIGRNIGINAGATTLPLRNDFFENILFFGANKQEQTTGVLMNALLSLMLSYNQQQIGCNFVVIDCLQTSGSRYKQVLQTLQDKGLCRLVERQNSGNILKGLIDDIKSDFATPTILVIIGSERFIEVKRKMKLTSAEVAATDDEWSLPDLELDKPTSDNTDDMTYSQALMYLFEEGPMHGIHTLLQVDKPSNILFTDDYDVDAANKFRHKVILRSENKNINPLRFSQDIDVDVLSDEEEHLRAYYYPDGDDPVLFTPYQMPDSDTINN